MKALETLQTSCLEAVRDLLSQPDFFEFHRSELKPSEQSLAGARYNGARSGDEAINLRVGAMRMLGMSDRAIERECGVDRRTIPFRLAILEQRKLIPAVKDRVLTQTAAAAESSGLALNVLLERSHNECSMELAGMIKSVATAHGITVEKLQLLTGAATEILEVRLGAGRDEMEAWAKANAIPIESTSMRVDANPEANHTLPAVRPAGDTRSCPTDQAREAGGGGEAFAGGQESTMDT